MAELVARQYAYDGRYYDGFWWTPTGQIVRWSILGGIFTLIVAYLLIGYWHAKRRIRMGAAPLRYHRWLLSREERARYDPSYRPPVPDYVVYQQNAYGMHPYAPPPPVYDPNSQSPPVYQPPAGASKVDPSQWRTEPTRRPTDMADPSPAYAPPPGPPPAAALRTDRTGESSVSNNPYRLP